MYSGVGAVAYYFVINEYDNGNIILNLKTNGEYELQRDEIGTEIGEYTIIDNTLLLKTSPSTCGPGADCSAKYSQYLTISDDCSQISEGYGSLFFNPNFTLN